MDGDLAIASSDDATFVAGDPVALLGLVKLVEVRTWAWTASDDDIDETLAKHDL